MNRKKRKTAGVTAAVFAMTTLAFSFPEGMTETVAAEESPVPAASFSAEKNTSESPEKTVPIRMCYCQQYSVISTLQ